nr:hypothetical protein [uncultured Rhodoferax sp.]
MRRVARPALPTPVQTYLDKKQQLVAERKAAGSLDVDAVWKQARATKTIGTACALLQGAMGPRERCMYCLDSHGTDIEHFKPKARYPLQTFKWNNWLLCCSECGRLKGSKFPTANGKPLLINPANENPWTYLEFDSDTGNLTARFDVASNDWSPKGVETVSVLHLDRREALAAGYRRTYQRLAALVTAALAAPELPDAAYLMTQLKDEDEHGLLEWCFCFAGEQDVPFQQLRKQHATFWRKCQDLVA